MYTSKLIVLGKIMCLIGVRMVSVDFFHFYMTYLNKKKENIENDPFKVGITWLCVIYFSAFINTRATVLHISVREVRENACICCEFRPSTVRITEQVLQFQELNP